MATVHGEIQQAIDRNQKEEKNLKLDEKVHEANWKHASNLLSNASKLAAQQKTTQSSQEYETWQG
eukprot:CAMPEP_0175781976 /NCGR_PEP_ID=MMETSP0097-20121207/77544_1 /TAXON_ID=311494 /ORGANISM="Alexandrium monilatum, Strain CCMP3105" /LENGTH=64 /DNA_ID=CAMNT_0017092781 /DNA_START=6 /DNA_END=197 /DNA_ORIENTATION=-